MPILKNVSLSIIGKLEVLRACARLKEPRKLGFADAYSDEGVNGSLDGVEEFCCWTSVVAVDENKVMCV